MRKSFEYFAYFLDRQNDDDVRISTLKIAKNTSCILFCIFRCFIILCHYFYSNQEDKDFMGIIHQNLVRLRTFTLMFNTQEKTNTSNIDGNYMGDL